MTFVKAINHIPALWQRSTFVVAYSYVKYVSLIAQALYHASRSTQRGAEPNLHAWHSLQFLVVVVVVVSVVHTVAVVVGAGAMTASVGMHVPVRVAAGVMAARIVTASPADVVLVRGGSWLHSLVEGRRNIHGSARWRRIWEKRNTHPKWAIVCCTAITGHVSGHFCQDSRC